MTFQDVCQRLSAVYEAREARAVARILIEELFAMSYADILCGGVEKLSAESLTSLEGALSRLVMGEPLQYVLGYAHFARLRFDVAPSVLIPRPETEWLVNRAEAIAGQSGEPSSDGTHALRLLDIGTGSGCIAVSLKSRLPWASVEAWDISADALRIARANAARLGADVTFRQCDALNIDIAEYETEHSEGALQLWNIIVSNPPYVCLAERASMDDNVLCHEPHTALFVPDDDPLLFYKAIGRYAIATLRHDGVLLFECNTRYAKATADMLLALGFDTAEVADDCFGLPRFVEARKCRL